MEWSEKVCGHCACRDIRECIYTHPEQKWPNPIKVWIRIAAVIIASWILVALLVAVVVMW